MLNQGEEKGRRRTEQSRRLQPCEVVRFFSVCGIIVVKRKITANLAVIFLKNGGR
jgi:hypothetical protein